MGSVEESTWQAKVAVKQKEAQGAIPEAWRLPESITKSLTYPLEENANRLIEMDIPRKSGLLSERELDITENNTVAQLLTKLASGELTSLEVTTAFCKRAAIAQQLVSTTYCFRCLLLISDSIGRLHVSLRFSSTRRWKELNPLTKVRQKVNLWGRCTAFQLVSKTVSR